MNILLVVGLIVVILYAISRRMNIKLSCKLPFVNLSLEAQQPSKDLSQMTPSTDKR